MTRAELLTLDELILRLTHIPERVMRRAEVRRWVRYSEPNAVVSELDELLTRCASADTGAQDAALTVADFLVHTDEEDRLALEALDLAAVKGGFEGAALLVSAHPPHRELDERGRQNTQLKRHVPLGMRRWRARQQDRRWLEVLMADLDPLVVANVCANPKVIEDEVLLMASRRPNTTDVLDAIAQSRWLTSDRVRRALIQNPYARTGLVISLLPLMPPSFLAALRFSGQVHAAVAQAARYLLARCPTFDDEPPADPDESADSGR